MPDSVEYYNKNAIVLFERYESVSFEQVNGVIWPYLPSSGRLLEVGCGSGRDSAFLADNGFDVTAVEPCASFRSMIQKKHAGKFKVIDARFPHLVSDELSSVKYDVILVNAVWMHLSREEQLMSIERLRGLLSDDGIMFISWRSEVGETDREFYAVDESLLGASKVIVNKDSLNRPNVAEWRVAIICNGDISL